MKKRYHTRRFVQLYALVLLVALLTSLGASQTATAEDSNDVFESLKITKYAERQEASDFTLQSITEEKQSLSDYKGRVVLLNFWTTW